MSIKRSLAAAALVLSVAAGSAQAAPTVFNFEQAWNGGLLSGSFTAEDLNLDGAVASFDGEVSAFSATLTGASVAPDLTFDLAGLWGLVYLVGTGVIGDDPFVGAEGLGVEDTTFSYDLGVGIGPLGAPCDGILLCGEIFDLGDNSTVETTIGQLLVTNDTSEPYYGAEVPLPAGGVLLLGGLAALGLRARRG
ncbi:hypothetical protein ACQ5SO_13745 [Rhodovulum sp. DZ06]|uniref:hypothetical protein n=1 Tax=Rhodovulum sp. DZ06 TaxID=3425126 RepID=UPI003D33CE18